MPKTFASEKPRIPEVAPDLDLGIAIEAGLRLKQVREMLGLRYRDVEQASLSIAQRLQNDEFAVALSRLSDIENKGVVPTIYRLYTLAVVYKIEFATVLAWYGVDLTKMPGLSLETGIDNTHLIGFSVSGHAAVELPISLDPGADLGETTYLSRIVAKWGTLPLAMLDNPSNLRYGIVGEKDRFLYPLIAPGALVVIDESRRIPAMSGWTTEFERPIYFFEHADGFVCAWCTLQGDTLILQPHPASGCTPQIYRYPDEIRIIGQVTGVAMSLDRSPKRQPRS
ncbi:MAG: helix-turn-helix transcriptional regulator [Bryobacteraceae bacterium]